MGTRVMEKLTKKLAETRHHRQFGFRLLVDQVPVSTQRGSFHVQHADFVTEMQAVEHGARYDRDTDAGCDRLLDGEIASDSRTRNAERIRSRLGSKSNGDQNCLASSRHQFIPVLE